MNYNSNSKYAFSAFITNLGKYNEGQLVGEWVGFPTTRERLNDVFEKIGIGSRNQNGNIYEEYFITDYDTSISGLTEKFGEYESIDELNYLANQIMELDESEEFWQAALSFGNYTGGIKDLINLTENMDCFNFLPKVGSDYDLGYYYIEESGAFDTSTMGNLANYIDYESYGRDVRLDEGGMFTDWGYIVSNGSKFVELYDGTPEDIPEEYKVKPDNKNTGLSDNLREMRNALDKTDKILSYSDSGKTDMEQVPNYTDEPELVPRL